MVRIHLIEAIRYEGVIAKCVALIVIQQNRDATPRIEENFSLTPYSNVRSRNTAAYRTCLVGFPDGSYTKLANTVASSKQFDQLPLARCEAR